MIHSAHQKPRRALTLLELSMVLVIMVSLAALVVPLMSGAIEIEQPDGTVRSPKEIATSKSLEKLRTVLTGETGRPGVWDDIGHRDLFFPRQVSDLLLTHSQYQAKLVSDYGVSTNTELTKYNVVDQIGWRGPYLPSESSDAWGNTFQIDLVFDNGQLLVAALRSYGEDETTSSDDLSLVLFDKRTLP